MKHRSFLLSIIAFSFFLSPARAEVLWVDGVSLSGGWYDANKVNPYAEDGDNNLCWAASAANLIAWWQDKYQVPSGTPADIDSIWSTYKSGANADTGGDTHAALQWWLTGVYVPLNSEEEDRSIFSKSDTSTLTAWEGYYYDLYGEEMYGSFNFHTWSWENDLWDFFCGDYRNEVSTDNIISLIAGGCGMGLAITNDSGSLGHAITLWGLEYDSETNSISRMWLTDSDDAQYSELYNWFEQDGLFSVDVESRDDKLYISTSDNYWYAKEDNIYISNLFAVNPAVSDVWGIPRAIPEPASATLSLLALAGITARRRRK